MVDGDHPRSAGVWKLPHKCANSFARAGGGEHHGGLCIAKHRIQTFGMAGKFRREQRHRDVSRLDRCEESGDVIQPLRRQDRHPLTGDRDLLQARGEGVGSDTELAPGQLNASSLH